MSKRPSMASSGVTAQKKSFVELIEWHACSPVVLQINDGAARPSRMYVAGGDGLLCWRVQHECTGTRGQHADSQV